jgi:hypothetical protein
MEDVMAQEIIEEEINHPLLDQLMEYHRVKDELEREYWNRWIIMVDKQVIKVFDSYDEAEAFLSVGDVDITTCLLRHVGAPTSVLLSHG